MRDSRVAVTRRALTFAVLAAVLVFWAIPSRPVSHYAHRKKVRFWHMWTAEWKDVVDKIVDRFNKSQDEYEVEALSVPSGAETKFVLGVLGGDPPDVMAQWNPVISPWAEDHLLTPLEDLMSQEDRVAFENQAYPIVKKLGTYKGRLYGMSIGINLYALYYLPEYIRQANADPDRFPTTLEELSALGDKMDRFDRSGHLTRIGWLPTNWPFFATDFGGGFYDRANDRLVIDSPDNLAALSYVAKLHKKLGFDEVVRFTARLNTQSFTGGWDFIGGAYATTIDGQWRVEQMRKYAPNLEYRTIAVPPPAGGKRFAGIANGNFMIVPRDAKEKRGAWEFIKYWSGLSDPDVAAEFYTWGGWLPLTPAVANAPIYRVYMRKFPQFKTFVDMMPSDNLEILPPVPYQTFLSDRLIRAEDMVSRGSATPQDAMRDLSEAIAAELKRRRELGN